MRRKPVIYISGKITGNDRYRDDFAEAERFLWEKGFNVINPCTVCELDFFGYEDFMRVDFALIDVSDAIFMLENWTESPGAVREYGHALSMNKTVLYQGDEALADLMARLCDE